MRWDYILCKPGCTSARCTTGFSHVAEPENIMLLLFVFLIFVMTFGKDMKKMGCTYDYERHNSLGILALHHA